VSSEQYNFSGREWYPLLKDCGGRAHGSASWRRRGRVLANSLAGGIRGLEEGIPEQDPLFHLRIEGAVGAGGRAL